MTSDNAATLQPTLTATKKSAKKAPAKGAKKGAKKAAKGAKSVKKSSGGRAKKEGLRKPQVRVLRALNKSNRALNRSEVGTKAEVDVATLTEVIGSSDPKTRAANDKRKGWDSLITLGFVKEAAEEEEGTGTYYNITAAGKKALEKVAE